jgi:hypothetical protein
MASAQAWKRRVAAWRESGRSSEEFCKGKSFTAGGLRHWAYRLRRDGQIESEAPVIRIGRVLRQPAPVEAAPSPAAESAGDKAESIVVELGAARVAVRPGFDRPTLAAVLDVLASGAGRP